MTNSPEESQTKPEWPEGRSVQPGIYFTREEYESVRQAFHVALLALHYANTLDNGLRRNDENIQGAIGEVGKTYKMVKAKIGDK